MPSKLFTQKCLVRNIKIFITSPLRGPQFFIFFLGKVTDILFHPVSSLKGNGTGETRQLFQVTALSSLKGRKECQGRGWGELKKSGTLASRASSPFHLKSFLSLIHSFRFFVCLTNHYNHSQFNGEECEPL